MRFAFISAVSIRQSWFVLGYRHIAGSLTLGERQMAPKRSVRFWISRKLSRALDGSVHLGYRKLGLAN
jgi:hypothetical protein